MSGESSSNSCLVSYTMEERGYTQSYVFNGTINSTTGKFTPGWGTARRTVSETTTFYKGDYQSVKDAAQTASTQNNAIVHPYEIKKSDGPWWEATVTSTIYGTWEVVQPSQSA